MFKGFSDQARIWIYGFDKKLSVNDLKIVKKYLDRFLTNWKSHKEEVKGAYEILDNRFVILTAESSVSGCSIDSSVSIFRKLELEYQLNALNQDLVFFKEDTEILSLNRETFQQWVNEDRINQYTIVYDLTPTMLGVLRAGQWELPFSRSWHSQVFKKSA